MSKREVVFIRVKCSLVCHYASVSRLNYQIAASTHLRERIARSPDGRGEEMLGNVAICCRRFIYPVWLMLP